MSFLKSAVKYKIYEVIREESILMEKTVANITKVTIINESTEVSLRVA